jgi:hypothetical protein
MDWFFHHLLSRRRRFLMNAVFVVVSVVVLGVLVLDIFTTLSDLHPTSPTRVQPTRRPTPRPEAIPTGAAAVNKRNIFCSDCGTAGPKDPRIHHALMGGRLLATLTGDHPAGALAFIRFEGPDRVVMAGPGEKLGDATVKKISTRRVELIRKGRIEILSLLVPDNPSPDATRRSRFDPFAREIRRTGPGRYEITRKLLNDFLTRGAIMARGVDFRPSYSGGKINGYRLRSIPRASVLHTLGVRRGDVVRALNNQPVTDFDKMLEMLVKLRGASHLSISLTRGGRPMTLDYTVR